MLEVKGGAVEQVTLYNRPPAASMIVTAAGKQTVSSLETAPRERGLMKSQRLELCA